MPRLRVPVLLAQEVQHVGRVTRVEHPEAARQPERRGVPAHQAVRHRVKRPAQHARRRRDQAARPLQHLPRRPPRERQQQDPLRRHALATSHATRAQSVVVLPVPAPARISSGPPACVAAARCSSLSSSSQGRSSVCAITAIGPWTLRSGSDGLRTQTSHGCLTGYRIAAMEATVRPLRADAARNRARVLDAARTAFAEAGLDVGVEEIARRAGVGKGTLYRRFPTKQALVRAIFEDILEEIERIVAARRGRDGRRGRRSRPTWPRRPDAGLQPGLLRRRRPRLGAAALTDDSAARHRVHRAGAQARTGRRESSGRPRARGRVS